MLENSTKSDDDLCKIAVAPYAGAWIETVKAILSAQDKGVAPYAGAWIETINTPSPIADTGNVAPYAGAWIETRWGNPDYDCSSVAPYAGAWIETTYYRSIGRRFSRSLRGSVD